MWGMGGRLLAVAAATAAFTVAAGARMAGPAAIAPDNTVQLNMSDFDVAGERPNGRGPNVGLICVWAIDASLAEIGRRCGVAPTPAVQAALDNAVSRMEAYARVRSPEAAARMERYKQRAIIGDPRLCSSDMVDAFRRPSRDVDTDIAQARRDVDQLLAQSPPVEWGDTCV
jgi:hypothetical protein